MGWFILGAALAFLSPSVGLHNAERDYVWRRVLRNFTGSKPQLMIRGRSTIAEVEKNIHSSWLGCWENDREMSGPKRNLHEAYRMKKEGSDFITSRMISRGLVSAATASKPPRTRQQHPSSHTISAQILRDNYNRMITIMTIISPWPVNFFVELELG